MYLNKKSPKKPVIFYYENKKTLDTNFSIRIIQICKKKFAVCADKIHEVIF